VDRGTPDRILEMKPYYQDEWVTIYHGDCREILPKLPKVDLVLTDPPYGLSLDTTYSKFKNAKCYDVVSGDDTEFDPSLLLALDCKLIIWGGNCFANRLPNHAGWLAWFKTARNATRIRQAEMELAWTNFITRSQAYRYTWIGVYREAGEDIPYCHPTQKPLSLMKWCLMLVPDAQMILDPYLGSGTVAMASKLCNRKSIGIEIEEKYCEIAAKRCCQSVMELKV